MKQMGIYVNFGVGYLVKELPDECKDLLND